METESIIKDGVFYEEFYKDVPYENITGIPVSEVLYQGSSQYQDILVFDSVTNGRMLVLDGVVQLSDGDEFAYHETLAFSALACHKEPKKVLIVGGGDGGMAREAAKFPAVESITVCEIDEEVVNVCTKLFPNLSKSFQNPKVNLVIEDAFKYLSDKIDHYDVIICDSTDPGKDDEANCLFTEDFYNMVNAALKPAGIFLSQTGNCTWQGNVKELQKKLLPHFAVIAFGFVSVPVFQCSQNGFIVCCNDKNLKVTHPYWQFNDEEISRLGLCYYNTDIHRGSFALPTFFKRYLEDEGVKEQNDVVKWMKSKIAKQKNYTQIMNGDSLILNK